MTPLTASVFGRNCYTLDGKPWGFTDGHAMGFRRVETLEEAKRDVGRCVPTTKGAEQKLPPPDTIARTFHPVYDIAESYASRNLSVNTDPDSHLVEKALARYTQRLETQRAELDAMVRKRDADLQRYVARGASTADQRKWCRIRDSEITLTRKRVEDFRENIENRVHPAFYVIQVGPACFDVRLLRRAMRWLLTGKGVLRVQNAAPVPAILYTERGVAVVLPLRDD